MTHLIENKTDEVSGKAYRQDEQYTAYLRAQIAKSYHCAHKGPWGTELHTRTAYLVGQMQQLLPEARSTVSLLSVGCRSATELDYMQAHLALGEIVGLDVFSEDPRIVVGDMHKMPFDDDRFDIVYACHSLEHAHDVSLALEEFVRVARKDAMVVIEVPIHYQPSLVDRWDLESSERLLDMLSSSVEQVLFREDTDQVCRVIVRLK